MKAIGALVEVESIKSGEIVAIVPSGEDIDVCNDWTPGDPRGHF